ncbi:uncharacterized protein A1O9_07885 [Exophiala aquamarina CBS 119918]|uniref:Transcription initiation factor TFIIA large subunit n=1 Tax=Exophiala aquamarina CBS 119918 TaxID=1182545 RepID=A0A072P8A6_9EURO|nr:uncharacterized protein A1O9_07885 [Exophiala aquamarina CBS 119918]KEF56304.1 hypothetical protein A1O9_07885 [Exophiala aquamarina CBS 119918]
MRVILTHPTTHQYPEWQKKLSSHKVAQLPWDPQPIPIKEQTLPSNAKPVPQTLPSNANAINTAPQPPAPSAPPLKAESSTAFPSQLPPPPNYQVPSFPQGQPLTARERAAQNLHDNFGHRAGAQIAQLQSNQSRAPLQPAGSPTNSFIKQEDSQGSLSGVQDYHGGVPQQSAAPIRTSQTDGASEERDGWTAEYARRKALASSHGAEGDRLMKAQFMAKHQELQAGGLLLSLDEHNTLNTKILRRVNDLPGNASASRRSTQLPSIARAQGDAAGDDDDEIEDEDAINSDLDDPDDLGANEEDGENTDQVMLCTYDKVQRVKNKWKCTLKDGVLRVEGNEYVFHKGQGEFEW